MNILFWHLPTITPYVSISSHKRIPLIKYHPANKKCVCIFKINHDNPEGDETPRPPVTQPPPHPLKAPVVSGDDNIKIIKVSTSEGDLLESPLSSLGIRDGVEGSRQWWILFGVM